LIMKKILIANWKENPLTEKEAIVLAKASDESGVVVCPPNIFLLPVLKALKEASLGAQDGFYESTGPFTGEVSMSQLKAAGAKFVIVGHSKRRELGETDSIIAHKVAAALESGLVPVVCVGEAAEERAAGKTKEVVDRQLRSAFSLLPAGTESGRLAYVAYEPVWAISTNQKDVGNLQVDTPESAQTLVRYLQGVVRGLPVNVQFLYGGSVSAENVAGFLRCPEFSGVLVGGASIKVAEIKQIIKEISQS
jgi:triosephosphate isomerase